MVSKVTGEKRKIKQKLSKNLFTNIRIQGSLIISILITTSLFLEHCNKKDHDKKKEKRKKKRTFRRNFQKIIAFRNHNKV